MASDTTTPEDESGPTEASEAVADTAETSESGAESYSPEELEAKSTAEAERGADVNLDLVLEVPVSVSLQVGSTDIAIRELVKLVEGSVIALDRESTDPMDVLVNGKLIAHGEIVIVDDQFGVRLTDVVSPVERIENIG